jgi:hypothetical protein
VQDYRLLWELRNEFRRCFNANNSIAGKKPGKPPQRRDRLALQANQAKRRRLK